MFFYLILASFICRPTIAADFTIHINTDVPIRNVTERFVSTGMDMYTPWNGLNFSHMLPFAKALSPAYFRFGGTSADLTVFNASMTYENIRKDTYNHFSFTGSQLDELYNFVNKSDMRLIFDLNLMVRNGSEWDPSNAQQFIDYGSSRGYDMDFELGNEPSNLMILLNRSLTGEQIADSYRGLRALLDANSLYKNSKLIGPAAGTVSATITEDTQTIVKGFFNNSGEKYISALSIHHYYGDGAKAKYSDFLNYTIMDKLYWPIHNMKILSNYFSPLWFSETSSEYGGGAPHLSDAYIAGFLWQDKLGMSAYYGVEVVCRWNLYGGGRGYSLLDGSLQPMPDYWLTLLHKKLVGTQVFNVTFEPVEPNLRLYGASATNNGFVIYGQSMLNHSVTVDLPQFSNKQVKVYVLKEGEAGNLQSLSNRLNGMLLNWTWHTPQPNMKGQVTILPITIPEYSQFFIVAGRSKLNQCPGGWYSETSTPNKCIKIFTNTQPWFGAQLSCDVLGQNASLLTINSAFENNEVLPQTASNDCAQSLIGLVRNGSNWVWSNGDMNTYRNWQSQNPTNEPTKNCVAFDNNAGKWYNVDCDQPQCYICQLYY